jgi:hypothetical protein
MSILLNNSEERKKLLKHMIKQLHAGEAPEDVNKRLLALMQKIPYGEVVEVEQELIAEGLPEEEVFKFCDIHSQALEGNIDLSEAKTAPPGHPVDTFLKENDALLAVIEKIAGMFAEIETLPDDTKAGELILRLRSFFNQLMDVDKHYQRKENLLFPYLERYGITGPPKVMWGKHDETRGLLKGALEALKAEGEVTTEEFKVVIELALKPAVQSIREMTFKESEILFPMTLDRLNDHDWYEIYQQTDEIGYCLYDPEQEWKPSGIEPKKETQTESGTIQLKSGGFSVEELTALLNTLPVDLTFVDRHDKVKFFTQGNERIFARNRSILNRDIRLCHPPSSVNVVEQIINDFKSGKEDRAPFWINLKGKFIHIEYFALRNAEGDYLGTLEVSQDLTEKRRLEGEQRLLSYAKGESDEQK